MCFFHLTIIFAIISSTFFARSSFIFFKLLVSKNTESFLSTLQFLVDILYRYKLSHLSYHRPLPISSFTVISFPFYNFATRAFPSLQVTFPLHSQISNTNRRTSSSSCLETHTLRAPLKCPLSWGFTS